MKKDFRCFSFGKCHCAEKCKREDHLGFINIHSVAKYEKTRRGPFGDIKKSKEVAQSRKKINKGVRDPLGTSGFVGFLEKVKNERGTLRTKFALAGGLWSRSILYVTLKKGSMEGGTLCTKFALAEIGRSSSLVVSVKKWTFQCEVCGLEKQAENGQSRRYI